MTTETTDPLEQAVMEAAEDWLNAVYATREEAPVERERLRLHVELALAKARAEALNAIRGDVVSEQYGRIRLPDVVEWAKVLGKTEREIAALEARLQED